MGNLLVTKKARNIKSYFLVDLILDKASNN